MCRFHLSSFMRSSCLFRVREDEEAVTVKEEPSKSQRATKSERDQVGTQDQPTRKR